jgi:uncharacterized protein YndB with AHSA1/START domain
VDRPALVIDHAIEVAAPAALVWSVITDLARYPEWNPFVVECRSDLRVGSPIDMRVVLVPGTRAKQREHILEHVPGARLCYGLERAFFGGISSRRCHVVRAASEDRTYYESRFSLGGPLAPLVRALLGRRLEHGFEAMTEALGRRAETLGREARR